MTTSADRQETAPTATRNLDLRGSANRRVAYVARDDGKALESLWELPSMKSYQPIGGSSKSNITLSLAGVSKTSSATYNTITDKLSYTPTSNLAPTTYKVEVTAKASGNSVYRMWWIKRLV